MDDTVVLGYESELHLKPSPLLGTTALFTILPIRRLPIRSMIKAINGAVEEFACVNLRTVSNIREREEFSVEHTVRAGYMHWKRMIRLTSNSV